MHALVTGGAGFVGGHLASALLGAGYDVSVLDDLSTGSREGVGPGVRLVVGDIRDEALVEELVASVDTVFHLAAAVGAQVVAVDPTGTWARNVEGSATLLRACARHQTPVLLASSSEVYGPDCPTPFVETQASMLQVTGRREIYALSKAAGEAYALALHRSEGLPVVVVRLFNVVGAGQSDRYGMVLPRFARAARLGEALSVYGDGTQRRCFLHVEDATRALVALLGTPAAAGAVVNVGSTEEIRILDLARLVLEEAGGGEIAFVPFHRVYGDGFVDPPRRVPDLAKLSRLTGFEPRKGIRDAVRDLLACVEV
jgi:UDP-glucose 4-epimerase